MAEWQDYFGIVASIGELGPIPAATLQGLEARDLPFNTLGYRVETLSGEDRRVSYLADGDPDEARTLAYLQVMQELGRPVHLQVMDAWRLTIVSVVVDGVVVESRVDATMKNWVFLLDSSSRSFRLSEADHSKADFATYRNRIQESELRGYLLLVTVAADGISVSRVAYAKYSRPVLPPTIPPTYSENDVDQVTSAQADACLARLTTTACPTAGNACVPFNYPEDGCWARAHAMCQTLLNDEGVTAAKVWIKGRLEVETDNHENCRVRWGWHVAVFVRPEAYASSDDFLVFDPAVSPTTYLSLADWRALLGGGTLTLKLTSAAAYLDVVNGVKIRAGREIRVSTRGGGLTEMDDTLDAIRAALNKKSPQPPYACP
jgi:hypothetical protein